MCVSVAGWLGGGGGCMGRGLWAGGVGREFGGGGGSAGRGSERDSRGD